MSRKGISAPSAHKAISGQASRARIYLVVLGILLAGMLALGIWLLCGSPPLDLAVGLLSIGTGTSIAVQQLYIANAMDPIKERLDDISSKIEALMGRLSPK